MRTPGRKGVVLVPSLVLFDFLTVEIKQRHDSRWKTPPPSFPHVSGGAWQPLEQAPVGAALPICPHASAPRSETGRACLGNHLRSPRRGRATPRREAFRPGPSGSGGGPLLALPGLGRSPQDRRGPSRLASVSPALQLCRGDLFSRLLYDPLHHWVQSPVGRIRWSTRSGLLPTSKAPRTNFFPVIQGLETQIYSSNLS